MKTVKCHVHYTFLKSESSARYSSDSGNGSNISVDLGGFLTQARHINRTIYTVTTMISKIVPAQAAPCRTKMQLACNKSYFDFYKIFYFGRVDLIVEKMPFRL